MQQEEGSNPQGVGCWGSAASGGVAEQAGTRPSGCTHTEGCQAGAGSPPPGPLARPLCLATPLQHRLPGEGSAGRGQHLGNAPGPGASAPFPHGRSEAHGGQRCPPEVPSINYNLREALMGGHSRGTEHQDCPCVVIPVPCFEGALRPCHGPGLQVPRRPGRQPPQAWKMPGEVPRSMAPVWAS